MQGVRYRGIIRGAMGANQTFRLPITANRTFNKETVQIDGIRFENCQFINCKLIYSGNPSEFSACLISPDTQWEFRDAAGMTMKVLGECGWRFLFGDESPEAIPTTKPN